MRKNGEYDYVGPPSENGTFVVEKDNDYFHVFINKDMKPIPLYGERYEYAGSFSEGLAWARKKNVLNQKSEEFHIKINGRPAYKERYDWVGSFLNGVTRVIKDKKEFHIKKDGKPLYKNKFDKVGMFRKERAQAKINKHYCLREGKLVGFPKKFFYIRPDGRKIRRKL